MYSEFTNNQWKYEESKDRTKESTDDLPLPKLTSGQVCYVAGQYGVYKKTAHTGDGKVATKKKKPPGGKKRRAKKPGLVLAASTDSQAEPSGIYAGYFESVTP